MLSQIRLLVAENAVKAADLYRLGGLLGLFLGLAAPLVITRVDAAALNSRPSGEHETARKDSGPST